jgi:hypothetical protein
MASAMRDQALALAREQLPPDERRVNVVDLLERPGFRIAFLQALAIGVAQTLARYDQRVLAVYAHAAAPHPGTDAGLPATTLTHMLVLVTAPSAALEALVTALNRALSVSLSGLAETSVGDSQPLLDISLVTEQQVQRGFGLAGLLSAVRPRPVKLWPG